MNQIVINKKYSALFLTYHYGYILGGENSGATALFDGGTFNKNPMVLVRTILVLKDILFKFNFRVKTYNWNMWSRRSAIERCPSP